MISTCLKLVFLDAKCQYIQKTSGSISDTIFDFIQNNNKFHKILSQLTPESISRKTQKANFDSYGTFEIFIHNFIHSITCI